MTTNKDYAFNEKWSAEIEQYNFTQVPNLLLACQGHLKLTDGEILTLIHLLTFWFRHEGRVYPSITKLTKFSHKGYSTIQRRLRVLEEKDFLTRRQKSGTSSTYDLIPCVIKLYEHQKVCLDLPRKQLGIRNKLISPPSLVVISKEDEYSRRQNLNNTKNTTKNISEILGKYLESGASVNNKGGGTWLT